jgi:Caspase domain
MREPNYRALLIGNSTFPEDPHNLPELRGPVNDIALLRGALTDSRFGMFEPDKVRLVVDRTKREITTAIEEFYRVGSRGDRLLLYYSGHGVQDEDGNLYLCARDTRTDVLVATGVSDLEINAMLRRSNSDCFIMMLDCCYSGGFRTKGGGMHANLAGSGRFLLTSARRSETARDASRVTGPSLFTKYVVEGMLLGSLDQNGDGYISLNELYDYVHTKLRAVSQQIPQRHFDAEGDIAVAYGAREDSQAASPSPPPAAQPVLAISQTLIELNDVEPDEELPAEVVDVFNQGGGLLRWELSTEADWIELERHESFFKVNMRPCPGTNRSVVHVRAIGAGGSQDLRIVVRVAGHSSAPKLRLSPPALDFGTLSLGERSPQQSIRLLNDGGGRLRATVEPSEPRIVARQLDDIIRVQVDTSQVGSLDGWIEVASNGGDARVRVLASVEPGPVLMARPTSVDFGRVTAGTVAERQIKVRNGGHGRLHWEFGFIGDFLIVDRAGDNLRFRLHAPVGRYVGSAWIRSNGGEVSLDIRADVVAPARAAWPGPARPIGNRPPDNRQPRPSPAPAPAPRSPFRRWGRQSLP